MNSVLYKTGRFFYLMFSRNPADRLYLKRRIQRFPLFGKIIAGITTQKAKWFQRTAGDYASMQKKEYEYFASMGNVSPGFIDGDAVVGSLVEHDVWPDYENFLMKYVPRDESWVALEYGCGPGRNIRRWTDWFKRIDGVDIAQRNLDNAKTFISDKVSVKKQPQLFLTEGMDCGDAPRSAYNFAFSTICLQHICVHSIRCSIFKSLFDCLKSGGRLSVQMGFGTPSPNTVPYHADNFEATATNRACDVAVSSPDEVEQDLARIGFINFEYWVRPVGPGDLHPQWIFFTAIKP
jgi:SAM-dependent methyltransferase